MNESLKWGTKVPIKYNDKKYGWVDIVAFGSFSYQVLNQAMFINNQLSESNVQYMIDCIVNSFSMVLSSKVGQDVTMLQNLIDKNEILNNANSILINSGLKIIDILISRIDLTERSRKKINDLDTSIIRQTFENKGVQNSNILTQDIVNSSAVENTKNNPTFNQNVGQSVNANGPTLNQQSPVEPMQQPVQSQSMTNYEQPIMQEHTPQPMNTTFGSGNTSNQNFNSKPPKKMNLGLIIGIVAAVVVVGVVIAIFIFSNKNGNKSGIGNNNSNSQKNSDIKQISITSSDIVTLTNNGDLYYVGDEFSTFFDSGNEDYKDLKKVASNVKKFYNNNAAVYYIDNQQDLYYFGSSYNAGSSSEIKKDYSGAKDVVAYMNFCGFVIKNNNELYVKNNGFGDDYCGLNIEYEEFTKVADDVIKTFANGYYSGYINGNNELYLTTSNAEFKKILDNVMSVSVYGFRTLFIMTNDNKLYIYDDKTWDNVDNYELKLLREDVNELGENYFKTINGEYNVFSSRSDLGLIKDESKILYESDDNIYYGILDVVDIKEILYYDSSVSYDFDSGKNNEQKKLIYISNDDKLVLLDKNNNKKIAYNTDSLKEIFEFVISKNLVED